jgi:hypothetical protein
MSIKIFRLIEEISILGYNNIEAVLNLPKWRNYEKLA